MREITRRMQPYKLETRGRKPTCECSQCANCIRRADAKIKRAAPVQVVSPKYRAVWPAQSVQSTHLLFEERAFYLGHPSPKNGRVKPHKGSD